jgi:hypothetical protein
MKKMSEPGFVGFGDYQDVRVLFFTILSFGQN